MLQLYKNFTFDNLNKEDDMLRQNQPAYEVYNDPIDGKNIIWSMDSADEKFPSLAEIISVAQKEFPGVPFDKLYILPDGEAVEGISLAAGAE